MLSFSFNLIVSTDIRLTLTDMTDFNWYHDTEKLWNFWMSDLVITRSQMFPFWQENPNCFRVTVPAKNMSRPPLEHDVHSWLKLRKINSNIFLSLNIHQNEL